MENNNQNLIKAVELSLRRKMASQRDFVLLSEEIRQSIGENVSPTTLRRLWGRTSEEVTPRRYTLDILARFLHFGCYDEFCANSKEEVQSNFIFSKKIMASELYVGQMLRLSWSPDRVCVIQFKGNEQFVVVDALNTKLSVGDTFVCHLFMEHEPAYLDNLIHEGTGPYRYVAGKKAGITIEKNI